MALHVKGVLYTLLVAFRDLVRVTSTSIVALLLHSVSRRPNCDSLCQPMQPTTLVFYFYGLLCGLWELLSYYKMEYLDEN